jgi:hypothetical protein
MVEQRLGKYGQFGGCVRFPFCIGTVPTSPSYKKPHDSYTQLLLDAHKRAVRYLSRADMLGKDGCVRWFIKHPLALTDNEGLLTTIDAASAEASRHGAVVDFVQLEHSSRIKKLYAEYMGKYPSHVLRRLPKPVFTRRWDDSLLKQIELDLTPPTTIEAQFEDD